MRLKDIPQYLMLLWLTITGLVVFGLVVAWHEGLIEMLVAGDRSRISLVIALLYFLGTLHCAYRVRYLSNELDMASRISDSLAASNDAVSFDPVSRRILLDSGTALPDCEVTRHIVDTLDAQHRRGVDETNGEPSNLTEAFAEHLKGGHELGWFLADILLKLGLIGTIVGFVLMLGSVANTASLDVNTMQKVLRQMSAGMGTALFTTLAGLVGSILLGLQYLLVDKSADELLHRAIRLSELDLLPSLKRSPGN